MPNASESVPDGAAKSTRSASLGEAWLISLACLSCILFARSAHVDAQASDPATAMSPAAESQQAPSAQSAVSATTDPRSVDARIRELSERIAAQERENAQQRSELAAYKARLEETGLDAPAATSSDAELSALLEPNDALEEFEPGFRVYGFMDVGLQRLWGGFFESGLAESDATNFVLGNVNLYFDATPLEHWRMLTEVRFTTLPNGAESSDLTTGVMERQSTAVFDNTSSAGGIFTLHWGSIILERAQIEWTPTDLLNLRVGYFLTPYGIWNVDHGSPTRIMLRPPFFVSSEMFPEHQTGVEIFGVFHALPWDIGYSVYVSNGRTVGTVDFSDDKAVGGRLYAKTRRPLPMQFGASIFRGTTQDWAKSPGVNDMGQAILVRKETLAYSELGGGFDLSLDLGALRIRGEVVARVVVQEPGKHGTTLGVVNANSTNSGGYLLFAYRLPWYGLEPFAVGEFLRYPTVAFGEVFLTASAGLNVYFNVAVTLRMQYSFAQAVDFGETSRDHSNNYLHILASRLIISF